MLADFREHGELPLYKALLEAGQCEDLATAVMLADEVHGYTLDAGNTERPDEYAERKIAKLLYREHGAEFRRSGGWTELSEEMVRPDGLRATSYGLLRRIDAPELGQAQNNQKLKM